MTWRIDYAPKWGIVGKILDVLFMKRMNENNSERTLANLKRLSESD